MQPLLQLQGHHETAEVVTRNHAVEHTEGTSLMLQYQQGNLHEHQVSELQNKQQPRGK